MPTKPKPLLSERDGRALAVTMLRELDSVESDPGGWELWNIEARYRLRGTSQTNIARRFIAEAFQCGNPDVLCGFSAVLTDFIANGGGFDPGHYLTLTEYDIHGKPGPWPTIDDDDPADAFARFMSRALPRNGGDHA